MSLRPARAMARSYLKKQKTHNKKRKFALTLLQLFARQFIIYMVGRKAARCAGICRHKSCFSNYARYLSITLSMIAYIFIYRHELKSWNKFLWLSLEIESCREGRTGRSYRSWLWNQWHQVPIPFLCTLLPEKCIGWTLRSEGLGLRKRLSHTIHHLLKLPKQRVFTYQHPQPILWDEGFWLSRVLNYPPWKQPFTEAKGQTPAAVILSGYKPLPHTSFSTGFTGKSSLVHTWRPPLEVSAGHGTSRHGLVKELPLWLWL